MGIHTFNTLKRRITNAGFTSDFFKETILPDWWSKECERDPNLLTEIEIRIARFLGVPLDLVRNPASPLAVPQYAGAQLRRAGAIERNEVIPAIHAAIKVSEAVVRNYTDDVPDYQPIPVSADDWRRKLLNSSSTGRVTLREVLTDVWNHGISVVPLDKIPSPSFQAAACIVDGHPVILIAYRYDQPERLAFFIIHETEHIISGDCQEGEPVIDYEFNSALNNHNDDIEHKADDYAIRVLLGSSDLPDISSKLSFRQLAREAARIEKATGADATTLIFGWARNNDWQTAMMALKALYRDNGGRDTVSKSLRNFLNVDEIPQTDSELLRAVYRIER